MCMFLKPQSDTQDICSVATGVCISLFWCLKFINDDGVDVYAFIYDVNYMLGLPPLPTTNTTCMGVSIYGLWWCDCCTSHWWFEGPFWYENGKQRIFQDPAYSSLVPCICGKHPLRLLEFCSCCLCYVHTSVWILVMNASLLPTENRGHCASLARIQENTRDPTTNGYWCGSYHRTP